MIYSRMAPNPVFCIGRSDCVSMRSREFVSVETVVSFGKFVELLRNSVIELLSQKSGLQLRRTRRRHVMYYRVRAPIRLLEQHAVAIGYRLQLRGEVDPGPDFWNDEEVAEDGVEVRQRDDECTGGEQ